MAYLNAEKPDFSYPCVGASPAFAYGTTVATGGGTSAYAGSASASVAAFAYGKSVSAAVSPDTYGGY